MLIPYSTDAPIYHFPWMTIGLIVTNAFCFDITRMGLSSDGWMLTYGDGLHPLEWIAYNFLHFGPIHLIGNMFFLWAFGIVIEGKLGWWKFLSVYLGIGILGGMLIQIAMLGYSNRDPFAHWQPPERSWIWSENSLYAQEGIFPGVGNAGGQLPPGMNGQLDDEPLENANPANGNPGAQFPEDDEPIKIKQGAGGASLIIYGLIAIVLIWAPRNEIHCLWVGFRSGAFEIEYIYFCAFYIVTELLSAFWSVRGFEVTSEVGHLTGALLGAGVGVLLVKRDWVDCENWDLFSIIKGKHSAAVNVGSWQNSYAVPHVRRGEYEETLTERAYQDDEPSLVPKKKKKAKQLPKLVELDSFDADFEEDELEFISDDLDDAMATKPAGSRSKRPGPSSSGPSRANTSRPSPSRSAGATRQGTKHDVDELVASGQYKDAVREYLDIKSLNADYQLEQELLRQLADGLFKSKEIKEAATFLDEFIRRFPTKAAHQRVKLSILYIKYLRRPTAALKLLVKVDNKALSEEYQPIYAKAVREAQRMISDGITDSD